MTNNETKRGRGNQSSAFPLFVTRSFDAGRDVAGIISFLVGAFFDEDRIMD